MLLYVYFSNPKLVSHRNTSPTLAHWVKTVDMKPQYLWSKPIGTLTYYTVLHIILFILNTAGTF